MPLSHLIRTTRSGIRSHRRLIAVWVGSLGALATVMAVGAVTLGGDTLDAGHATPPPHPLDSSHPCTWYVLPNVSNTSRRVLEVGPGDRAGSQQGRNTSRHEVPGPPQTPQDKAAEATQRATQREAREEAGRSTERAQEATGSRSGEHRGSGGSSPTSSQHQMYPTENPDPIVNAPTPVRPGSQ